jgi:hypothetical protein
MMPECAEEYGVALDESGQPETGLRAEMCELEERLRGEMQVLEQRLQQHDELVARVVEALEYLRNAVLELAPRR